MMIMMMMIMMKKDKKIRKKNLEKKNTPKNVTFLWFTLISSINNNITLIGYPNITVLFFLVLFFPDFFSKVHFFLLFGVFSARFFF